MDDTPMPETLDTIALSLRALRTSMDQQFQRVDEQFKKVDQKADEVQSRLEIKLSNLAITIEAVHEDVRRVYDVVISHQEHFGANAEAHDSFTKRLDNHDVRILALEHRKPRAR